MTRALRSILLALLLVGASQAFVVHQTGRPSSSALSVAIDTSDIKNGLTIELEGEPYKVSYIRTHYCRCLCCCCCVKDDDCETRRDMRARSSDDVGNHVDGDSSLCIQHTHDYLLHVLPSLIRFFPCTTQLGPGLFHYETSPWGSQDDDQIQKFGAWHHH